MFNFFRKKIDTSNINNNDEKENSSSITSGLKLTFNLLSEKLNDLFTNRDKIDNEILKYLETILLTSDIGHIVTKKILSDLKNKLRNYNETLSQELIISIIKDQLNSSLALCNRPLIINNDIKPYVILVVGVNGSGKTTTIAKLGKRFQDNNNKVMFAAGDTFRAAAIEQLSIWGNKIKIPVISQRQGADSAAVIFDAYQAAIARKIDVLIADTAGRMQSNKTNMLELTKIKKIIQKINKEAPHEVLLIIDATIGQNALEQTKIFSQFIGVTGIIITKLDGSAKGGILFAIAEEFKLPIRFIGIGENIDDLKVFSSQLFVQALFGD